MIREVFVGIAGLIDLKGRSAFRAADGLPEDSFPRGRKRWLMGDQCRENSGRLGTDGVVAPDAIDAQEEGNQMLR